MSSTSILRLALASVNATPIAASPSSSKTKNSSSIPRATGGRITKTRKPKINNSYSPSAFRPHVPASDRLRYWSSPHAIAHHHHVVSQIPAHAASNLINVMLLSLEPKTRSNYGAGLLRFTQFCDANSISEHHRCPASEILISAFIASFAGLRSTDCINGWLAGIKWWHTFQGADWHGANMLASVKKGIAKAVPESSRRSKREPITLEHMHCLLLGLDLTNAKDAAIYAASCVAFHGICRSADLHDCLSNLHILITFPHVRSSELCIPSRTLFDPSHHVTNSVYIEYGITTSGVRHANFHIPWSKTTGSKGAKITLTDIDDPTSPVAALKHHKSANTAVPSDAPLFAFESVDGGWEPLMKTNWLERCNQIWIAAGFEPLKAHAFRIGGCTEMLLRGIQPDIVCIQGRWKSKSFLEYWRTIQFILPTFISKSFSFARVSLVNSSMDRFSAKYSL
jgi:hypothetical protein